MLTEYLRFSRINSFVSAVFIKTINCVGEPLNCHLNKDTASNIWDNFKGSYFEDFKVYYFTSKILSSNFCQKSKTDITVVYYHNS